MRDNPEEYADSEEEQEKVEKKGSEKDGSDASDGDEDKAKPTIDVPEDAEAGEGDPKMDDYKRKLKMADLDDADTDDEYTPLEIRTKVHTYRSEHGDTLSSELMSEAFRWRLSQTDC